MMPTTLTPDGSAVWVSGDGVGYEANASRFLAQISTPMTAILDGRNSWVSRVRLGSNYTVNTGKLYCWRLKCKSLPIPEDAVAIYKPLPS